jgi:hypothetical protein
MGIKGNRPIKDEAKQRTGINSARRHREPVTEMIRSEGKEGRPNKLGKRPRRNKKKKQKRKKRWRDEEERKEKSKGRLSR